MLLFAQKIVKPQRLKLLACSAVLCALINSAYSQLPGFLDPKKQVETAVTREINKALGVGAPIRLDVKTAFPEVNDDAVGFHAPDKAMELTTEADLKRELKPGSYAIPVFAFNMMFGFHEPGAGQPYKLGRVQGKVASPVSSLLSRGLLRGFPAEDLNAVVWRLEDGCSLDELPKGDKEIIHEFVPDSEKDLKGDLLHQIRAPYDKVKFIPGLPKFEDLLDHAGAPGHFVANLYRARALLLDEAQANRGLPEKLFQPLPDGKPFKLDKDTGAPAAPWAEVLPGVFAHLVVDGGIWKTNYLEIRVTEKAAKAEMEDLIHGPSADPTYPTIEQILGTTDVKPVALVCYAIGDFDHPELLPSALLLVPKVGPPDPATKASQ